MNARRQGVSRKLAIATALIATCTNALVSAESSEELAAMNLLLSGFISASRDVQRQYMLRRINQAGKECGTVTDVMLSAVNEQNADGYISASCVTGDNYLVQLSGDGTARVYKCGSLLNPFPCFKVFRIE
tara:strand:- start:1501 stop:1890 length:390 start_codon:yes stop_codon:yes gene_type:complete